MVPIVLFDLDNTLVDRASAFRRWAEAFADERQLGRSAVEWLCACDDDGFSPRAAVFEAVRVRFFLSSSAEEMIDHYRATYPSYYEPDVAILASLGSLRRAGWRIGVVTNGPPSQIVKIDRSGLRPLLDGWSISDEVGIVKPDSRIFRETVRRCGGDERSVVWMVGDTAATDIDGGRRAGCRTIWLRRGRPWEATGYAPDVVVDSVADAVGTVLTMSPEPDPGAPRTVST